ncbi:hypothetical protein U9M48_010136 [Paspalum notatum var. saurae]|uniref:Kelch repeat-containing F-box family protein n=1 Tax=Paspalum notatum var. saurae TaxID=547442 RepID=A0AAQ3WFT4_PASNO
MPCRDRACPRGFDCVAVPDQGALLVCSELTARCTSCSILLKGWDASSDRWAIVTRMLAARSFFASGVIDERVYVAGGYNTDQFELSSTEVLDPVWWSNAWERWGRKR